MIDATTPAGLTILVNSTDRYSDCWEPFFKLFATYWPDCSLPIVLNAETKSFEYAGLDLRVSRVGAMAPDHRLTWSEALSRCLDTIETPFVLYLQEDYFLNAVVEVGTIAHIVDLMDRADLTHVRLMELGGNEPYRPSELDPMLWRLPKRADYLTSLQAGLWRTKALRGYLPDHETPWQFERWGTIRARPDADGFLCQNMDIFNRRGRLIVPYVPTGIVRGKWYQPAVVPLFADHQISVDFTQRGFYRPGLARRLLQKARTKGRPILMRLAR